MEEQSVKIVLDVKPSLIAAWFHRLLTNPVVEIDGSRADVTSWGRTALRTAPGKHHLTVYFRYRGQKTARLGESTAVIEARSGQELHVVARLGPRNGSDFRILTPRPS
jgi:hypothetical protein